MNVGKLFRNFAIMAILGGCANVAQAATYSVSGGQIKKDGATFTVKGVNIPGPNWYWDREVTQDTNLIANVWKFNAVRVNCLLKKTDTPWQQYTVNNDLNKIVNEFTSRGVVVIFDAHDQTGSYYTDSSSPSLTELSNWFKNLATTYKNNSAVWFEVQNEPGAETYPENNGQTWLTVHQRIIKDIRSTGNNSIILCEGTSWGQDAGTWDANNVPEWRSAILTHGSKLLSFDGQNYNNIVFSIHVYDQFGYYGGFSSDSKIADYIGRVKAKGYALIIGEYGTINAGHTVTAATDSMWKALKTYPDVGRMVWQWDGGDSNDLTVWDQYFSWAGSGWGINKTDGTKPTNLSTLGNQVWDDNHSNSGGNNSGTNLLSNPGFEAEQYNTQTPSGWGEQQYDANWNQVSANASYSENYGGSNSGNYHGTHWSSNAYKAYTYQYKNGLTNGLYTLRIRAKTGGGQNALYLEAKDFGGSARTASIPVSTTYQTVEIRDINVTNGQCMVGIWSDANAGNWTYFDDAEFVAQENCLTGYYYDNSNFSGTMKKRVDKTVNFSWAAGTPIAGIAADTFSVRWKGYVVPKYSQTYTFYTKADDGVRLWVNGVKIVDRWTNISAATENRSTTINLTAGQKYSIVMEYYENTGSATAQLLWSSSSQAKQIIPDGSTLPDDGKVIGGS